MKVLVLGSGGREHAFAWKIAQSPQCKGLFIAPGNAGTSQVGTNVSLDLSDFDALTNFVQSEGIDLVVVGPEQPLVDGLADHLRASKIAVIGPGKAGARLEGSKEFSKAFMKKYQIPTAAYRAFESHQQEEALAYVRKQALPVVVKASGLAAGKGVLICESHQAAEKAVREMLSGASFGEAGTTVVIEEFLKGIEISIFVLTDGTSYKLLPSAKDYKRIGEGDTGLNTGGMGAVSPVPFADESFLKKVKHQIVEPTLQGLKAEGIPYQGFIFIGLMVVGEEPYVLEYNVRMGDPETEVVIPRIDADLLDLFKGVVQGKLAEKSFQLDPRVCTTVMLVSGGYPEKYEKGKPIRELQDVQDALVFHAGTRQAGDEILTNGGRVMAVTCFGESIEHAIHLSLTNASTIQFEGKYYRTDIGQDLMEK
jgi:phosphoribosylamine--glycine ligase